ncbi:MAG: dockerin type I domain-containing protein [Candidatus Pacebacteria bacterium]|nr:dockerin type I domain-containing protein [Candidatus Paceibacterota bacterium]
MTVNGTNFVNGAVVKFDGNNKSTIFINSTQLTAIISASDIISTGNYLVTVANPSPVLAESNAQTFAVGNPIPTTTDIFPTSKTIGDAQFILIVNGTNFILDSIVRFNGSNRTTTYINSTQLTATIPASDLLAATSTAYISVFNPTPGGGLSNSQTFTVYNPTPTTTSMSPTNKNVGDSQFTLTVNGTNFVNGATIKFDGSNRTTTFVSSTQLTAIIPSTDLTSAGTFQITVANPSPVLAESNAQTFVVVNATPVISSISPDSAIAGDSQFTMTVNGSNFFVNSIVNFNGSARTTTYVSQTELTAVIPASDLLTATSSAFITVVTDTFVSNSKQFVVNNPVPTTTDIDPATKNINDAQFTITVNGTNFVNGSVIRFNGSNRTTTYASSTQLMAIIPASDLIVATSTAYITVFNSTPGGGTSNAQTFTVIAPDITAPTVTAFSIPSSSDLLTISITSFTATDDTAVTGYLIKESATAPSPTASGWVAAAPTSYTFSNAGNKTLYAWAKDAAGNVSSSMSASITITYIEIPPAQISNLFSTGVITPTSGTAASTTQVIFNQETRINFGGGTEIIIPVTTNLNTVSGSDFSQLSATTTVSTSDISSSYTPVGAVGFGLPASSLSSSAAITISIAVNTSYNGQTLTVLKKATGATTWVPITTCLINSGICQFTVNSFSEFAVGVPIAGDIIAPAAITDLVLSAPTTSSITVTWTATGDDANIGTATSYDLRYSTSELTPGNFDSAIQVSGEPTPLVAGTVQSIVVSGLNSATTYYFAIKAIDEVNNIGDISNIVNLATLTPSLPGVTPSTPSVGPPVEPTSISFAGRAYPGGTVKVYRRSLIESIYKNTYLPDNEISVAADGTFNKKFTAVIQSNYLFAVEAIDKDGRSGGILGFTADLLSGNKLVAEDIFVPPTIALSSSVITKGKQLTVSGYATPGSTIEARLDNIINYKGVADSAGKYQIVLDSQRFGVKSHTITVRQIDSKDISSNFSPVKNFTVSLLAYPKADLNNDGVIDAKDWSIFLFRWKSLDENLKKTLDMNSDGKIDSSDLSIFLKALKGL